MKKLERPHIPARSVGQRLIFAILSKYRRAFFAARTTSGFTLGVTTDCSLAKADATFLPFLALLGIDDDDVDELEHDLAEKEPVGQTIHRTASMTRIRKRSC